jgi:DNA-binding transcriptional MocR family regulator
MSSSPSTGRTAASGATATLPQLAPAEYLAAGGYAHHLRKLRRAYADRVNDVAQAVQRHFPAGTRATRPAGGHVLWVELPPADAMALFESAAEKGVSIAPGPPFSTAGGYRNFLRLNCSWPADARLEKAIQTLGTLLAESRPGEAGAT